MLEKVRAYLTTAGVAWREVTHEPTPTSEDSARARGEALRVGGKALVLKIDDTFRLFVLSAACRLDSAAIKRHFEAKRLRFATAAELHEMTGLAPGAVPPLGTPVLPLDLFVDQSILENEIIAFNAGSLTTSMILAVPDYLRVARPTVLRFSR